MTTIPKAESTALDIVPLRQREPLPDEVVLAIATGDLAPLEPRLRAVAIRTICEDGGLPVSMSPVILMPGKDGILKPYVTAIGASWVADNKRVSTKILSTETVNNVHIVRMAAYTGDGRSVEDIGAVAIGGLGGQYLADAMMKAVTKAYRRTVLRLSGLPLTDLEEGTGPPRRIDYDTGEILDVEATVVTPSIPGKPNDDSRSIAAKHLFATIRERYGKNQPISDIGHDLVCTRFGLESTKDADEEQLRAVAAAVRGWSPLQACDALDCIRLIAGCPNASQLVDLLIHFDQTKTTDAFVHAALADALTRMEAREEAQLAETDARVDGVMIP